MAVIVKPVINEEGYGSGDGLELFEQGDIYRYDIDNRPLLKFAENDVALKDAIDLLVDELTEAYVGKKWSTNEADYTFADLDERLDNMDTFLQELFEIRNVQFSSFQQFSTFLRERYTSGFMNGPYPNTFIRSNYAMENNEAMPSPYGGFYSPERAQTITDQNEPDVAVNNMIAMETRIEQDNGISWRAVRKPIRLLVNGYTVSLYNAHGGTNQTDQSIADRRACGISGPVTIGFPAAPATGNRIDFAFLEVFLNQLTDAGPFYPYGCRDFCIWSGAEDTGEDGDGATTTFSGQLVGRMLINKDEGGHYLRIFDRADASAIDWNTETALCEDDGSGNLVEVGGSGVSGTIDYETGEWEITAGGDAFTQNIIASYRYRAVGNPNDERLWGTLSFLADGTYVQIQNQIRVVPGVTYDSYPNYFTDNAGDANNEVEAMGDNDAPVATYSFTNALNDLHDGTLFRAGSGNAGSKTDLGTYDGYVYAIPLCAWSRFNQAAWALDNQNGGTDRPDGLSYDVPDDKHFVDLRPVVFSERYDMKAAAENTLDRIIRGDHRSILAQAQTDSDDSGDGYDAQGGWASVVPELWRVYKQSYGALSTYTNVVRDIGLATSADPAEALAFPAPVAWHDGVRQIFSPQEEVQQVAISITNVTTSNDASPDSIVTYNKDTNTITISTDDSSLSGYSATSGQGALINDTYPRLYWRGTRQPVKLATLWTGLGTNIATCVIDDTAETYQENGTIDGFIDLLYPESTGIARPVKEVDYVEFDDGVNSYISMVKGNDDGSADDQNIVSWKLDNSLEPGLQLPTGMCADPTNTYVYICDTANHRVVKVNASDLAEQAQWPLVANYPIDWTTPFEAATDLQAPVDVACDAAGNVYVVDREDHRLIKFNANLTAISSTFGTSGTATNDPESLLLLNSPEGVAVDSSGNVYIADTGLFRLVKLNSGLVVQDILGNGYSGAGQNQFIEPTGVCVGNVGGDDYIYVADRNRVVVIKGTDFTVDNVLGDKNTNTVQKFYRNTYASFYGFAEDSSGNKYALQWDRRTLHKFDSAWNLLATFGEDGVQLEDNSHFYHVHDVVVDEAGGTSGLLYVTNFGATPSYTRVTILSMDDLSYIDSYELHTANGGTCVGNATGMAFIQNLGGEATLYVATHLNIVKLTLPVPGDRDDPTAWSVEWTLNNASGGFTGANQFRYINDICVLSDGSALFVSDGSTGLLTSIDPTGGAPVKLDSIRLGWNWPPADNGRNILGCELSPGEDYVYVCGGGAPDIGNGGEYDDYEGVPHIRVIAIADLDGDSSAIDNLVIHDKYRDEKFWAPEDTPVNIHYATNGDIYVMLMDDMVVYTPTATDFANSGSDISGGFNYNIYDLPVTIDLELQLPWFNCRAVAAVSNVLYVADPTANSLTAVDLESLRVLGTIGNPSSIGRGKASFAGPGGVAVIGQRLFFSDTFNNRVVSGYRYFPNIERGTGRLNYLIAPPAAMTVTYQVRYTPYQGQWNTINLGAIYGRHFVTDNDKIYLTTMGRGTAQRVAPNSGVSYYANMISHIPTPADVPPKGQEGSIGARVTDEYLFAPQRLDIIDDGGTPFVSLPIINRFPSSAQEMNPWYGAGSRFDFNRFFFIQGPGAGHAVDSGGTTVESYEMRTPRGFLANGFVPGFDTLLTFPLQDISIPRIIFSTMTVELNGQGYLLIFSSYAARKGNALNNGNIIAADVFRLFGNPGIKTRY